MNKDNKTTTEEIIFTNRQIFKDSEEHPYNCECHDGVAYCKRVECKENAKAPELLMMGYPVMSEVVGTRKELVVREYRCLDDDEPLNYADIAIKYGKLGKYGFDALELDIIERLARRAKMDWLIITTEGNFKDGETGKPMSAKTALKQMVEGLTEKDYECLTPKQIIIFTKILASLL